MNIDSLKDELTETKENFVYLFGLLRYLLYVRVFLFICILAFGIGFTYYQLYSENTQKKRGSKAAFEIWFGSSGLLPFLAILLSAIVTSLIAKLALRGLPTLVKDAIISARRVELVKSAL